MIRSKHILASIVSILALTMSTPAWAVGIPVPNFSFETSTGTLNAGNAINFDDWVEENTTYIGRSGTGNFLPTNGTVYLSLRRDGIPDGVQSHASVRQTLTELIDTASTYTLTVDVGRTFSGGHAPVGAELFSDNAGTRTRIAATSFKPPTIGPIQLNLQVAGTELTGLSGQQLGIRLFTTQNADGGWEGGYDNVQLNKETAPTPSGNPTPIAVPDFSFEVSGGNDHSWTINPQIWGGAGWPISGTGYGQAATDGVDKGVNTAYQLLPDTFVEGATYVLTVDHSLRGDAGQEFDTGSIMFFRQNQSPGDQTTAFSGPTIGILDGSLSNGNNPAGLNGAGDWITQTLTYVATAADDGQRIGIMVTTASAYQGVYDNVPLTVDFAEAEAEAVPEPSTYALGLIGLAGLGLVVWRRRRNA